MWPCKGGNTWIQLTWYSWYNRCNWSLMRSWSKVRLDELWHHVLKHKLRFILILVTKPATWSFLYRVWKPGKNTPRQNACDVSSARTVRMAWSWRSWGSEDQDVQRFKHTTDEKMRRREDELRSLVAKEPDTKSGTLNLLKESEMGTLLLNVFCTVLLLDYCDLQQFSYAFCPRTGWTVSEQAFLSTCAKSGTSIHSNEHRLSLSTMSYDVFQRYCST